MRLLINQRCICNFIFIYRSERTINNMYNMWLVILFVTELDFVQLYLELKFYLTKCSCRDTAFDEKNVCFVYYYVCSTITLLDH